MPDAAVAAPFQNIQMADQITFRVDHRILQRITYPSLRRQMNNAVKPLGGEQRLHRLGFGNIHLDEVKIRQRLQPRQARLFQGYLIVAVEVINPDHGMPGGAQRLGHIKTDESGCAGD